MNASDIFCIGMMMMMIVIGVCMTATSHHQMNMITTAIKDNGCAPQLTLSTTAEYER